MELPSMVQRSGDTLIVRSVVSGNQLYMEQGVSSRNSNKTSTTDTNTSPATNSQSQNDSGAISIGDAFASITSPTTMSTLEQRLERLCAVTAQQQQQMLQQQQQQQHQQHQQLQTAVAVAAAVEQQHALELKDEGLPQCKIKRNYSCSHCNYFTQNPRYHLTHLRDVHGEKIVINNCRLCLYASRHYQKLVRHMKMVHGCTDGITSAHGQARGKRGMNKEARKRKLEQSVNNAVAAGSAIKEMSTLEQVQRELEKQEQKLRDIQAFNKKQEEQMKHQQQMANNAAEALFAAAYEHQLKAQRERELDAQQGRASYEIDRRQTPTNLNNNNTNAVFQIPPIQQSSNMTNLSHELTPSPASSASPTAAVAAAGSPASISLTYIEEPVQNRLLKCSVCEFTTLYRAQLLEHELEEHCKTKFFRCEKCSYVTHIKARFSKHVKYHSMPMIKCVTCDFRTPYKWNLDRHMKNHGGAGPFKCAACDFTADIKQSLTVHEMNHHVPPVGHATGIALGRRRNKVGGTDLSDDDSAELLEDQYNNNNLDEFDEALAAGVETFPKKCKYDEDEPTDLSQKGGSSDTSSVHNQAVTVLTPKTKKPIPNLIPIPKMGSNALNLSKPLQTRSSLTEIASMFFNKKQITEILQSEAAQLSPTTTVTSTSSQNSRTLANKKSMIGGSFFDKLKSSALTSGGPNENLICPCGHLAKCLSESIIHRKTCNLAAIEDDDLDMIEEHDDADDRLKIDIGDDDDKQSHSALNLSVTGSTRCKHCRHRCKSSVDLFNHLKQCTEAGRCGNESYDSMSGESSAGRGGGTDSAGEHPMENRVFVWNKMPRSGQSNDDNNFGIDAQQGNADGMKNATNVSGGGMANSEENSYYGVETAPGYGEVTKKMTPEEEAANSSLKKVYKCPHCSFWASTASRFHVHIVGHLNKKPFECSLCSYRSNWRWDITKHIRLKTIRDPSHKNARVLMNDETGRRNYTKYNKYITLMKVTEEDGDPKLMKSGEMTPNQVASLAFLNGMPANAQLNGLKEDITLEPIGIKAATTATTTATTADGGENQISENYIGLPYLAMMNAAMAQQQHQKDQQELHNATLITPSVTISAIKRTPTPALTLIKPSDDVIVDVKIEGNEKKTYYKCRKCTFRHSNRDAVLAHVRIHYQDPNYPIVTATANSAPKSTTIQQQQQQATSPLQVTVNPNLLMNNVIAMCLSQQQQQRSGGQSNTNQQQTQQHQQHSILPAGLLQQAIQSNPSLSGLALALAGKAPNSKTTSILEHGEQKASQNEASAQTQTQTPTPSPTISQTCFASSLSTGAGAGNNVSGASGVSVSLCNGIGNGNGNNSDGNCIDNAIVTIAAPSLQHLLTTAQRSSGALSSMNAYQLSSSNIDSGAGTDSTDTDAAGISGGGLTASAGKQISTGKNSTNVPLTAQHLLLSSSSSLSTTTTTTTTTITTITGTNQTIVTSFSTTSTSTRPTATVTHTPIPSPSSANVSSKATTTNNTNQHQNTNQKNQIMQKILIGTSSKTPNGVNIINLPRVLANVVGIIGDVYGLSGGSIVDLSNIGDANLNHNNNSSNSNNTTDIEDNSHDHVQLQHEQIDNNLNIYDADISLTPNSKTATALTCPSQLTTATCTTNTTLLFPMKACGDVSSPLSTISPTGCRSVGTSTGGNGLSGFSAKRASNTSFASVPPSLNLLLKSAPLNKNTTPSGTTATVTKPTATMTNLTVKTFNPSSSSTISSTSSSPTTLGLTSNSTHYILNHNEKSNMNYIHNHHTIFGSNNNNNSNTNTNNSNSNNNNTNNNNSSNNNNNLLMNERERREPSPYRCGHCHQLSNWKHVIQRHCRLKHGGDICIETLDRSPKTDQNAAPIYRPLTNGSTLTDTNFGLTLKALQKQQQTNLNNNNSTNNNNNNNANNNNNNLKLNNNSVLMSNSNSNEHLLLSPHAGNSGSGATPADIQAVTAYIEAAYKAATASSTANNNNSSNNNNNSDDLLHLQQNDQIEITRLPATTNSTATNAAAAANFTQFLEHSSAIAGTTNAQQNSKCKQQKCPLCPYISESKSQMNYHISLHKPTQHECRLCTFVCAKKQHLSNHMRNIHHQQLNSANNSSNSIGVGPTNTAGLNLDFSVALQLAAAARAQQESSPMKAPLAMDLTALKSTLNSTHSKHKLGAPLSPEFHFTISYCSKCPARFAQKHADAHNAKSDILEHLKAHNNSDASMYKCEFCDFHAVHETLIQTHRFVHSKHYLEKFNEIYANCMEDTEHKAPKLLAIALTKHTAQGMETILVVDNEYSLQIKKQHELKQQQNSNISSSTNANFDTSNSLLKKQLESGIVPPQTIGGTMHSSPSPKVNDNDELPFNTNASITNSELVTGGTSTFDCLGGDGSDNNSHVAVSPPPVEKCLHCPYETTNVSYYKLHIQHHICISNRREAYVCDHCDYTDAQLKNIEEHTRLHFNAMEKLKSVAFFTCYKNLELSVEVEDKAAEDDAEKEQPHFELDDEQMPLPGESTTLEKPMNIKQEQNNNSEDFVCNENNAYKRQQQQTCDADEEQELQQDYYERNDDIAVTQQPAAKRLCKKIILYKNDGGLSIKNDPTNADSAEVEQNISSRLRRHASRSVYPADREQQATIEEQQEQLSQQKPIIVDAKTGQIISRN